jgi:hypothetical protein
MAQTEHLPIYKAAYDLCPQLEEAVAATPPYSARSSGSGESTVVRAATRRCTSKTDSSVRSDGRRGRRVQEQIRADPPFVGLIFSDS